MSKKYLHTVTVTVAQTFSVLAESDRTARAMALSGDHMAQIGTSGDISARVDGPSWLGSMRPRIGFYFFKGAHKCGTCHAALEYGTGNDYTCACEEVPSE